MESRSGKHAGLTRSTRRLKAGEVAPSSGSNSANKLLLFVVAALVLYVGCQHFGGSNYGPGPGPYNPNPSPAPTPISIDIESLGEQFARSLISGIADVHEQAAQQEFSNPSEADSWAGQQFDSMKEQVSLPTREAFQAELGDSWSWEKEREMRSRYAKGVRRAIR